MRPYLQFDVKLDEKQRDEKEIEKERIREERRENREKVRQIDGKKNQSPAANTRSALPLPCLSTFEWQL